MGTTPAPKWGQRNGGCSRNQRDRTSGSGSGFCCGSALECVSHFTGKFRSALTFLPPSGLSCTIATAAADICEQNVRARAARECQHARLTKRSIDRAPESRKLGNSTSNRRVCVGTTLAPGAANSICFCNLITRACVYRSNLSVLHPSQRDAIEQHIAAPVTPRVLEVPLAVHERQDTHVAARNHLQHVQ